MNIIFVCQKGELELKSLLLACSLRVTHGDNVKLIAAVPTYKDWGNLSDVTMLLLEKLSVEQKYFSPAFGDSYPIGNKISALALLPPGELGCFLDSDMLSLSAWKIDTLNQSINCAAKPADLGTWGSDALWAKVYGLFSMPLPQRKVRLTVNNSLSLPYFNAGFIATNKPEDLSCEWINIAKDIDNTQDSEVENKYPWLDQISLPIAMQKIGGWQSLDEFYNYPAHLRPLKDNTVGICHYHSPNVILREPRLLELVSSVISKCPELLSLIIQHEHWMPIIKAKLDYVGYANEKRNFLITGIPRSGTSFLTSLLDSQQNWVVVNEPAEIFGQLQNRTDASGIELYYADTREKILLDKPISNKVKNGKVIQDTAIVDQVELYHPQVDRYDFWLGSKNTLAYMASLAYLTQLNWPIVALIRNPLDTLASWRKTFDHLSEANVKNFPIANPDYPAWAVWQKNELLEIASQSEPALRRVLLWRLLAKTLLHYQQHIHVWRYEDLIADPFSLIKRLNVHLDYDGSELITETSLPRKRTTEHDQLEREMLQDLCREELSAFKYKV